MKTAMCACPCAVPLTFPEGCLNCEGNPINSNLSATGQLIYRFPQHRYLMWDQTEIKPRTSVKVDMVEGEPIRISKERVLLPLKTFSEASTCEKCGYSGVTKRQYMEEKEVQTGFREKTTTAEHFKVWCTNCGYSWLETVKP